MELVPDEYMFPRLLKINQNQSLLIFGARGTGKSTLLRQVFKPENCFWIDLLDPNTEDHFSRYPSDLTNLADKLPKEITHIVIDEVQKIPRLLDVVHQLIEKKSKYFILTGSSARKLKRGGANLLAGRAFVYYLYPLSFLELGEKFNLEQALHWGLLPKISFLESDDDKKQFLQAYAHTYLKEEIWAEQFIKKLDPFRRFLEVSAQANGKIINYANIARDVGVDDKTVKEYFSILEDSLVGFFLEPFHHSFRKRLSLKPKFYYFDVGVTRSLARQLTVPLTKSTTLYGEVFEHFIILECMKLSSYSRNDFRFSYLKTKDDLEVDLIVERPGKSLLFIEIKSSTAVRPEDINSFSNLTKDFGDCEAVCFSQDFFKKNFDHVSVYPWQIGIKLFFAPE